MSSETDKPPTAREMIDRQGLMDDMMERCGVDLLSVIAKDGGQSYVRARSHCRGCASVAVCRDWLLECDPASNEPQEFCPNSGLFRLLLGD
ncbi:DUF6455 family protein [Methyloceanibacter sp.]|uniref:DUF6455 family protein n=1 Tax=Methyloceanibacter sp. TaxID=1965321 RepID=UPI002D237427|nr:DUF6455 family protein [Methyloceanibacter sp.]HZP09603.1 DUF6455 family protein [Methyloceanibacter sp.]